MQSEERIKASWVSSQQPDAGGVTEQLILRSRNLGPGLRMCSSVQGGRLSKTRINITNYKMRISRACEIYNDPLLIRTNCSCLVLYFISLATCIHISTYPPVNIQWAIHSLVLFYTKFNLQVIQHTFAVRKRTMHAHSHSLAVAMPKNRIRGTHSVSHFCICRKSTKWLQSSKKCRKMHNCLSRAETLRGQH